MPAAPSVLVCGPLDPGAPNLARQIVAVVRAASCENAAQQNGPRANAPNTRKPTAETKQHRLQPKRALRHALRPSENSIFAYRTARRFRQPGFARASLRASVPGAAAFVAAMKTGAPQSVLVRLPARAPEAFSRSLESDCSFPKVTMPPDAPRVRWQNSKPPATAALQYF
jgi:hypothetical protein